jgi:hypothetical protein
LGPFFADHTAEDGPLNDELKPFRRQRFATHASDYSFSLGDMHGATIALDSKPGQGTRLTITFPPARTLHLQKN